LAEKARRYQSTSFSRDLNPIRAGCFLKSGNVLWRIAARKFPFFSFLVFFCERAPKIHTRTQTMNIFANIQSLGGLKLKFFYLKELFERKQLILSSFWLRAAAKLNVLEGDDQL
jgi:hypothetical protein